MEPGMGNVPLVLEDGPSLANFADILWRKRGVNHLPNQDPGSITEYCNSTGAGARQVHRFGCFWGRPTISSPARPLSSALLYSGSEFRWRRTELPRTLNWTSFVERDPSLPGTGLTDSFTRAARRKVLLVARGCMLGSSGVSNLEAKFRPINIWESDGSTHHASNTALMSCEALALLRTCQHPTTEFPKQS